MALLKAVISLIIFIALLILGYSIYIVFLSPELKQLDLTKTGTGIELNLSDVDSNVKQFYTNMRFNHNLISYYINPNCNLNKKSRMKQAFSRIESETKNLLSFYKESEANADILVGCSADSYEKEENIFVAGEGGPTRIVNSSMPVITKGKVLLYNESRAICDQPLLEIHELMHVFGYDHIDNEKYVMYPYLNCEQEINPELISHMIKIYSIKPYAELSFGKVNAYTERALGKLYLNFNISITNDGIIDAEETMLSVYSGNVLIESFELETIKLGAGKNFYVNNLPMSAVSNSVKFELSTNSNEPNKDNNIIESEL